MNLQDLAIEVERQRLAKNDYIAPSYRLSMNNDGAAPVLTLDLGTGAKDFPIQRHAHQQIAEFVGVPWKFYERLLGGYQQVLFNTVNGLLTAGPSQPNKVEKRMVRTLDGQVRAVLSDKYRPRDNDGLLNHLLPVFNEFPGVQFKRCDLSDTKLYIKTFDPNHERRVVTPYAPENRVGEVVRFGVIITNSEVGAGALTVAPYSDVLSCRNGQVHTEFGKRSVHLGKRLGDEDQASQWFSDETIEKDDLAFYAKAADVLRGCLTSAVFDAIAADMQDLANIRIAAPATEAIEEVATRLGMTDGEKGTMLDHLIAGGDLSGWGYMQAATRTARDLDDADRQTEIEQRVGSKLTADRSWAKEMAVAS
jgi:hypothetical protein